MIDQIADKLSGLPEKTGRTVAQFVHKMTEAFGERVYSILLFGSAVGEDFIEDKSDINTLVILDVVKVYDLEIMMEAGRKLFKKGLAIPLIFEKGHIVSSLDTFPIEFSDMKRRHIVLLGANPLENAVVEQKNLRYQCERELKSIVVNLRRGFLRTDAQRDNIEKLLDGSIASTLAACRGLIWMKGKTPPDDVADMLADIRETYNVDITAIDRVWRLHKGQSGATALLEAVFDDYIRNIADLAAVADKL